MLTEDKGILLTNMVEGFPSSNACMMGKGKENNESCQRREWEQ